MPKKTAVKIPDLDHLIAKHTPKFFVVQLGSNLMGETPGDAQAGVRAMLRRQRAAR